MTMTTLSSEGRLRGLCGGMIKRNRSFMLYFGVLLFVLYPLQYMLQIFDQSFDERLVRFAQSSGVMDLLSEANAHHTDSTAVLLCMAVFIMTLVIGLAQFGYLHSKKAVDVYHGLPVNRSTLALANILAGFATVMVPLAANYLVVLVVGAVKRVCNPLFPIIAPGLLVDLLCWAVVVFAVLCIVAFVAVQVGSVFDNFLFSCELLVVCPVVIYLTINLFQQLLRGYYYTNADLTWILYTSPITLMADHYSAQYFGEAGYLRGLLVIGVWLLIALFLLWATLRLYRRRPSELAESSTSRKPLAQLGVLAATYIGGTVCGLLFEGLTGQLDTRYSFTLWTVIFSLLIYVLAQVILQRGFKGLRKALLPGLVTVGAIAAFCLVLSTGGLGYESRVPVAEDVASVNINYRGRYNQQLYLAESREIYEDSSLPGVTLYSYRSKSGVDLESDEGIGAVLRLHQVASDRSLDNTVSTDRRWASSITITYTLQNGHKMVRCYDYNELNAVEHELLALETTGEFKAETHPVFLMDAKTYSSFEIADALGFYHESITDQSAMQRLMDALRADMEAEDLTKMAGTTELAPCAISFVPAVELEYLQLTEDAYNDGYVLVRASYTNTLRVLRELGLSQFTSPETTKIGSLRVYYDNRFGSGRSPINLLNDLTEGTQYTRDMDRAYSIEENDMVAEVTDPATIAQITGKLFNIGCGGTRAVTVALYDTEGGGFGGYAILEVSDLPESVADQFPSWVKEEWADLRLSSVTYGAATESVSYAGSGDIAIIGGTDGPTAIYVTDGEGGTATVLGDSAEESAFVPATLPSDEEETAADSAN